MPAGEHNISAEQGSTFSLLMSYQDANSTPIDIGTYLARMAVKKSQTSTSNSLFVDKAGVTGPTAAGTGQITIQGSGVTGNIQVDVDAATMATMSAGRYFYDLELVTGSTVTKILKGRFTVEGEITT